MSTQIVSVEILQRIALVNVANPPVNTIDARVRAGLFQALEALAKHTGLQAAVIRCEGSTFFSGADIGEFSGPPKEEEYRRLLNAWEGLPFPVIAAMHGTVMGGGLELALACHYRIASPGTRFALPEVTLGIIPGGGGTQRLPRLIGADRALGMIVEAKPIDLAQALELGIVDREIQGDLREGALAYARGLVASGAELRRTGERSVDPKTAGEEVFARWQADARKRYPNRRAALTAVEAVRAAVTLPFEAGLVRETELVNGAKATTESKALVHVFFAERETRKVPELSADVQARPVRAAAIVGAGTMGSGIAICFANAGIPVRLLDANSQALERGLGAVAENFRSQAKRGRLSESEAAKRTGLVTAAREYGELAEADVIVEAVFESMDLKKSIFQKLDAVAKPGALLATNTSTLDIEEIARAVQRPRDVIGMHFFSPANVMPLLEVVRTSVTAPEVIRTAMDLSKPLKKTPVLARVCYGFIGNRMMEGYAREAERMVLEGATPRQVDSALEQWGMALGILAVFDMAGIDVGVNVHKANADKYPPDPTYYQADFALHEAGRLGQKSSRGYYRYEPGDRNRHDDPEALEILRARARALGVEQRQHSDEEIVERCLLPLMNEGIRILEEGVAMRASDIDVVWTAGYGFPRYRGGPMFHADVLGLPALLEGMRRYARIFGSTHWEPASLLEKLVKEGRTLAQWDRERR